MDAKEAREIANEVNQAKHKEGINAISLLIQESARLGRTNIAVKYLSSVERDYFEGLGFRVKKKVFEDLTSMTMSSVYYIYW